MQEVCRRAKLRHSDKFSRWRALATCVNSCDRRLVFLLEDFTWTDLRLILTKDPLDQSQRSYLELAIARLSRIPSR